VRVHLNCLEKTERDCVISIAVADTGIGIPEEAQRKVFERFSQADATTTRRYGGAGLGLAISRNLVEFMGGKLSFESKVGKGSTFTFSLKLPICSSPASAVTFRSQVGLSRILVLDDRDAESNDVAHYLQRMGLRHQLAGTQEEALHCLREGYVSNDEYHVVFISDTMAASILALGRAIETNPSKQKASLILTRSNPSNPVPAEAAEFRFAETILAPLDSAKVLDALARVVGERGETEINRSDPSSKSEPIHKLHVLIAEDNQINQKVRRKLLEKHGYSVDVAENGRAAIEKWTARPYCLILMDCQMPEMDGYEATREIRSIEAGRSHIPIIAVTANALAGDREKCLAAGMDGFVSKPIKTEVLITAMDEILGIFPGKS
jgi:two-component system, sensor histidine kinase and response regulator